MRLSDILDQDSDDNLPCVVYQKSEASILTYAAAAWVMKKHEQFLQHQLKLERQQEKPVVVAFLADNSADLLLATLACTRLPEALPLLLNTRWTPVEIAQALQSQNPQDCTIIVHDKNHTQKALQASGILRDNHKNVSTLELVSISSSFQTKASNRAHTPIISVKNNRHSNIINGDNDTALILFTSGTTSGSKGVLLSHRSLIIQAQAKLKNPCFYDATTKMLATTVPLFHVGGLSSALAVWMAGGLLVFPSPPTKQQQTATSGFQPQKVLQSLSQGPQMSSNTLVVVPAMLSAMMDTLYQQQRETNRSNTSICFPEVKLILIGGQSATTPLLKLVVQHFPYARIVQTYACTEGASSLTFWERKSHNNTDEQSSTRHHNNQPNHTGNQVASTTSIKASHTEPAIAGDCVGRPPSHIQLELFKPTKISTESGKGKRMMEPYTTGIIATRGPHLFSGYWRRGASVEKSSTQLGSLFAHELPVTSDGWFLTNDLGYRDEKGDFYFTGRLADVIRTGGETVLATEVERILLQHNDILECAVFALPDDKFGETVCAAVVSQSQIRQRSMAATSLELKNLKRFCTTRGLAGYKQPRRLFWVPQLPRNSSGKLLKRVLVEEFRNFSQLAERAHVDTRLLRSKL